MADANISKKTVSERRKQQNRQAQKNYRERQTRRLRALEALVETRTLSLDDRTRPADPLASTYAAVGVPSVEAPFSFPSQSLAPSSLDEAPARFADGAFLSIEDGYHELQPAGAHGLGLLAAAATTSSAQLDHGTLSRLVQEDDTIDATTRRGVDSGALTVQDVLRAGLRALSDNAMHQASLPQRMLPSTEDTHPSPVGDSNLRTDRIYVMENRMQAHAFSLPDMHVNCLRVKQFCTVAAVKCNAEMLGITFRDLSSEESMSQIYDASAAADADIQASAVKLQHISADLRPTAAQIRHPHHPWIDTIPSPTMRRNLVEFLSHDPPIMDEDDFCQDLEDDGLICWGSAPMRTNLPQGSGAPWDVRSWEAQPWFLRKWWVVLGGSRGELFQSSKWWTEMRGDRLQAPSQ